MKNLFTGPRGPKDLNGPNIVTVLIVLVTTVIVILIGVYGKSHPMLTESPAEYLQEIAEYLER